MVPLFVARGQKEIPANPVYNARLPPEVEKDVKHLGR